MMVRILRSLIDDVAELARPWGEYKDMHPLLDRIGDAQYVLLGEASHGTSEFYAWRSQISRYLIEQKGFRFIAVEGDWPDCYQINRYVKGFANTGNSAEEVLRAFSRWPTWMWANREIVPLIEWMRQYNRHLAPANIQAGFYGLDVYSLWESLHALIEYLDKSDPIAAEQARRAYRCFEPFGRDPERYAITTAFAPESCESVVVDLLHHMLIKAPDYPGDDEVKFSAEQNARVAVNSERYYRTMLRGDAASWNIRDQHMMETLEAIGSYYGRLAKGIVWAHNTHIGDARYTDMAAGGMTNIGELVRQRHGADAVLVGFATHHGSVVAARGWDEPMEVMAVPPARLGSWEHIMHQVATQGVGAVRRNLLLISDDARAHRQLDEIRGHRAIGVVYHPESERQGNYAPTLLPRRYDALIYLDETSALRPLHLEQHPSPEPPETFPWAV